MHADEPKDREPARRKNLSDDVAKKLEAMILAGSYDVGAKLPPEKDLAVRVAMWQRQPGSA